MEEMDELFRLDSHIIALMSLYGDYRSRADVTDVEGIMGMTIWKGQDDGYRSAYRSD